jgi:hypothetical protein
LLKFAAALLSGLFEEALVAPAAGATETITGQLIDIGNYAAGRSLWEYTGVHARACALEGFDVGLLTSDGKVYYVTGELAANSNAKLLPHMLTQKVTITGNVSEKDGLILIAASGIQ